MAFKLLAIQGLLLVVCLFGWFSVWNFNIVESIQPFFIRMKDKKTNQNGWKIASLMINWIIAGFHMWSSKIHTGEFSMLLSFFFHDVLE